MVSVQTGGLLNINKPAGLTSFQVVKKIRTILKIKRVGHCGTLDPMAQGVLLIVFGSATAFSDELMSGEKVYWGEMRLGIKTDTGDITGKVMETMIPPQAERETVEKIFRDFVGEIDQVPPMFSAIKKNGMKLYDYARKGIEIVRPPRKVKIHSLDLLGLDPGLIRFRVACSKGTYIRSLVEDIGEVLEVPATLSALTRERSGSFAVEQSLNWNEVLRMRPDELLSKAIAVPAR